jgi:hypothetical protein
MQTIEEDTHVGTNQAGREAPYSFSPAAKVVHGPDFISLRMGFR